MYTTRSRCCRISDSKCRGLSHRFRQKKVLISVPNTPLPRTKSSWKEPKRFSSMPFRCLLRIRFAEKFLKGICARQDENHKSSIGSCEWDFLPKRELFAGGTSAQSKKIRGRGYDPGLSGLSVFYGLSILPAPFRCLAGLPAASQASGRSHKRAGNPHRRPADLTSGRRPLLMIRQFP